MHLPSLTPKIDKLGNVPNKKYADMLILTTHALLFRTCLTLHYFPLGNIYLSFLHSASTVTMGGWETTPFDRHQG
jgi:hypothetical protein